MIITTSEEVDTVGKVEAVEYVELLVEGMLEVLPGRWSLRAATGSLRVRGVCNWWWLGGFRCYLAWFAISSV